MALVNYSSSDESADEGEHESPTGTKLELPGFLESLPSDPARFPQHFDDPNLHQCRQRSFPHETGNWATSVFINCSSALDTLLMQILRNPKLLHNSLWHLFAPVEELHLSLSKTWPIMHHWIDGLIQALTEGFSSVEKCHVDIFVNEEASRSFVALCTTSGSSDHLIPVVKIVDRCVQSFRGPVYYKDPRFHVSMLWCKGDITADADTTDLQSLMVWGS
ncbi:unnamed protein product [Calicophoron daubneyi]|uniref:U6 snRNA phosphodiesterase 1 n=1 Tax=Calicophoron daubneyi TaxID=300641 RepID=A0AAV2TCG8_CALDB